MIRIDHLTKSFNNNEEAVLKDVSVTLEKGKIYSVVGESGSGKTTLIRLICGLETPDRGEIYVNDELVTSDTVFVKPEKRKIGLVFQDYALFPHMTVYDNVVYGITKDANKKERVKEVLQLVGLDEHEKRYPHELSGGQQQRVALARALAPQPELLILDEPFSNLDAALRNKLRNEIFDIVKASGVTAIFVTHDTDDALTVSDEIIVFKDGILVQKGSAEELYNTPNSLYVASLFGELWQLDNEVLKVVGITSSANEIYVIRLEDVLVNESADYCIEAELLSNTFLGNMHLWSVKINETILALKTKKKSTQNNIRIGFNTTDLIVFN